MNVGDFPLTTLVETTRDDPAWREVTDSCYAWHFGVLASLTFDSAVESVRGLRSESGQPRVLIFTAAHLSLELEVMADLVVGQIVPPGPGEIVVETPDGTTFRTEAATSAFSTSRACRAGSSGCGARPPTATSSPTGYVCDVGPLRSPAR